MTKNRTNNEPNFQERDNLRVCYIAGREAEYSRTRTIVKALKLAGLKTILCLPPGKSFFYYPRLIWEFVKYERSCSLIIVGFYGQLLLPIVRLLTKKPILYDIYISTYDTMVYDRGKTKPGTFMARVYRFVDRLSMSLADGIILETKDHIRDYSRKFKIPEQKFEHLFLTVDENVIYPKVSEVENKRFLVHFHGEYAPFHGVRYILKAADILRGEKIDFQIIGKGITYQQDRALAKKLELGNVRFIDWVPYDKLADVMSNADCCLGIFGDNPRTLRVLTNKVVEALAVGKPLITARNQPVRELIEDGVSGMLVERANARAIASAILKLKNDPALRRRIGENGRKVFLEHCSMKTFSLRLKSIIERMVVT